MLFLEVPLLLALVSAPFYLCFGTRCVGRNADRLFVGLVGTEPMARRRGGVLR